VGPVAPARGPLGSTPMSPPLIVQFQCFLLSRGAGEWCFLTGCRGILTDTKSRLRNLGMRQNPSLSGPLKAIRRLLGGVWKPAGCRAKRLRALNPHRTASDSPAASFNLRPSEILPEPARTPGGFRGEDLG